MIPYILLLWIGIELKVSTWYYVLLGIGFLFKCIKAGYDMAKAEK